MPEEKKSTYSGQTEARRKANAKYLKESVEDIRIRVPKGQKDIIKAAAENAGESLNTYVRKSIDQRMEREAANNDPIFWQYAWYNAKVLSIYSKHAILNK